MENYENTLQNMDMTWGVMSGSLKTISLASACKNKELSEIDSLRASYLLNIDELYSEMLGEKIAVPGMITLEMKASIIGELTEAVFHEISVESGTESPSIMPELIKDNLPFDRQPEGPRMKNRDVSLFEN